MTAMRLVEVGPMPKDVAHSTREAVAREAAMARRGGHRGWTRLGVAVAVAAALAVGAVTLLGPPRSALAVADVAAAVGRTRTLRAVLVDDREGGTLLMSGTRLRLESDGSVLLVDAATPGAVQLDLRNRVAYRIPERGASRAVDLYGLFRSLAAEAGEPIEAHVGPDGKQYPGFAANGSLDLGSGRAWDVAAHVWIDPATKLPVRVELRPVAGEELGTPILFDRIEFDVPLDEAAFDPTIPPGYTIAGVPDDQLRPPPTTREAADELVLVPSVGMGRVRFGMTRAEVATLLGEPESVQFESYLNYPSRGLQLVLVGREPDRLGMILANPNDAANLNRREFAGRTDKGVGIGSTLRQVRDAYGEPDPPRVPRDPRRPAGHESLHYARIGLAFEVVDGKVAMISISRTD